MSDLSVKQTQWPIRRSDAMGTNSMQRKSLMKYLDNYLSSCQKRNQKGCLVYDIDETLLYDSSSKKIKNLWIINKF